MPPALGTFGNLWREWWQLAGQILWLFRNTIFAGRSRRRGRFEERFWSPCNYPVFGPLGTITHIIHRVEDVTEFVRLTQEGRAREQMTAELLTRTEQMESEIYNRSQELGAANRQLRTANEELKRLYDQISTLMIQADNQLGTKAIQAVQTNDSECPIVPAQMLARIAG